VEKCQETVENETCESLSIARYHSPKAAGPRDRAEYVPHGARLRALGLWAADVLFSFAASTTDFEDVTGLYPVRERKFAMGPRTRERMATDVNVYEYAHAHVHECAGLTCASVRKP
jgi:hypothetical protein